MTVRTSSHPSPVIRRGQSGNERFTAVITPDSAGWAHSGLCVVELGIDERVTLDTEEDELIVLPLAGSAEVTCDGQTFTLTGRESVFSGVTDFAYLPRDTHASISSPAGGRFALPAARTQTRRKPRYVPSDQIPVELRGAGRASRQVHNFCTPETFDADRLIAVEVITPGGNWSSYPPHKHDTQTDDESQLEEIYYFEVAHNGPAYQRVYSSGPDKVIDVCAEISTGDIVLIPYGYHGPSMAAPGYDLYYLNVMGGPGERAWRVCDDPQHSWIRQTWLDEPVDPRLPITATGGGS